MAFSGRAQLSDLDRRVGAGLYVLAGGDEALELTPDQVRRANAVIKVRCDCGHRGVLSCYRLADRGLGGVSLGEIGRRTRCINGCRGRSRFTIVDPYRSRLDLD